MKTKVLGILALVGVAAVTGVSIAGVSGIQSNINAESVSRSITYAYGVNQKNLNEEVTADQGITNAGSGTTVRTKTTCSGTSYDFTNSNYYCEAKATSTAGGTAQILIFAHIMNVTSVRAVYTVTSDTAGNYIYRPSVCYYSAADCTGTSKNVFFGAESTVSDGIEHDYTITTSSVGLTFTPLSVEIIIRYYVYGVTTSSEVILKSAVVSWSC